MLSSVGKESIISLNFLADAEIDSFSPSDKQETFAETPSGAIPWEGVVVVVVLVVLAAIVSELLLLFLESVDR